MNGDHKLLIQVLRFGVVGGSAFVIDAGLLFLFTEFLGIHYLISGALSFSVSVIYNYILSIKWVFETKRDVQNVTGLVVFVVLSVIGLGINQFIMWLFVDVFQVYYMLTKVIATCIVMIYNFVTRKVFIEKKSI